MKILLTGPMNIGKTTILEKTIYNKNMKLQGFITYPGPIINNIYNTYIREINSTKIFTNEMKIVDRSNKSKFFPEVFDKNGMEILNNIVISKEYLTVFDEIGSIESHSKIYKYKFLEILNSDVNFIGVIKEKDNPFLNEIREYKFIDFFTVTKENRDDLIEIINKELENLKNNF